MATAAAAAGGGGGGGGGSALGADLASPIAALPDKWKLLPAFLQARGLVKQHIESFDYFFDTELRNIVEANREVRSDVDPKASAGNGAVDRARCCAGRRGVVACVTLPRVRGCVRRRSLRLAAASLSRLSTPAPPFARTVAPHVSVTCVSLFSAVVPALHEHPGGAAERERGHGRGADHAARLPAARPDVRRAVLRRLALRARCVRARVVCVCGGGGNGCWRRSACGDAFCCCCCCYRARACFLHVCCVHVCMQPSPPLTLLQAAPWSRRRACALGASR